MGSTSDTDVLPDVTGFMVEDNGIGFNTENRNAFDTLFTDYKVNMGGKGVGRFIFLKYFRNAKFNSIYKDGEKYRKREFALGSKTDIIEHETDKEIEASDTLTLLTLDKLRQQGYDKKLDTIAKKLLERILVFFVDDRFICPTIILRENNSEIVLNNLIGGDQDIQPIHDEEFSLGEAREGAIRFRVKIYKIIYPGGLTSRLCLTAHGRVVTETSVSKYVPEFKDDFFDKDGETTRNYRIVAYIIGVLSISEMGHF